MGVVIGSGGIGVIECVQMDLLGEMIIEVELEEVVNQLLVDVGGLGLGVEFLEEVKYFELLLPTALEVSHEALVFFLQQVERSTDVESVVLVLQQQNIELLYQSLRLHLLIPVLPLLRGEVFSENHFLLLLQHLLYVFGEQLTDLFGHTVFLLLSSL